MEQGNLGGYPHEEPSYNKGQTGKGASIGGKVTAMEGESFPQPADTHGSKLKEEWKKAESAKSKFGKF
jgi:hypothetical protein